MDTEESEMDVYSSVKRGGRREGRQEKKVERAESREEDEEKGTGKEQRMRWKI